ncbi:MAG: hypothetical protein ABI681_11200 [Gemmatimonadales bacterium]
MTRIASLLLLAGLVAGCDSSTGPKTGSLAVEISGLPAGLAAAVSITGPGPTTLTATTSRTFDGLAPGQYQITATNTGSDRSTFQPTPLTTMVEVRAGDTPAQASVSYAVITAIVSISISNIPSGLTPQITLARSPGFPRTVTAAGEVGNLVPGTYTISAANLDGEEAYGAAVSPSSLELVPSVTPVPVAVSFTAITGSIRLSSTGLPAGAVSMWDITGINGFSRTATGTGDVVVHHLNPGEYTVTARNVVHQGDNYGSSSGATVVTVVAANSHALTTSYILRPPTLNLVVEGAYLTQAVQTFGGSIPLVAGRDAYLRVFLRANENNSVTPPVRLRVYHNGQLVATQAIVARRGDVPTGVSEQNTTDSWGMPIPGSMLQPGASFLVDVDPDNAVRETVESDNQFPLSGTPRPLDVRNIAPVNLRFIPVATSDGLTGNVSAARLDELVNITSRMHPVSSITADLRATYSTSLQLAKADSNHAWARILGEIDVLRVVEASGRQYVGVLKDNIGSGFAGVGYVPGRSVLIFDDNQTPETLAHELGHNWGRLHSPCGGPGGVDPQYPYLNGNIGIYGFDILTGRILSPDAPDVMSYCWLPLAFNISIPRRWASDYTYAGVMNFRSSSFGVTAPDVGEQDCLIVWGRITPQGLVLEPAFVASTKPSLPAKAGRFSLKALDSDGSPLLSLSFDGTAVADAGVDESHFVFAVPVNRFPLSRVASLSLTGSGLAPVLSVSASQGAASPSVALTSTRPGFVRLRWNARENPLLVVRDPATRQIISLARSGDAVIRTSNAAPDVVASDGIRSKRATLQIQR